MLQTPGSLKNRDVSLTAFSPPRTGSVWGDNWRVPWHAARERAAHSATQTLAHVSVCVKTTDRRRACLFACASVCAYARVYQRRRVIILFFLRRNPFLLSLRAPRSNEGWTWKGLTAVLRTACALCFFLSFLLLDATLSFHSSIFSCETPPVLLEQLLCVSFHCFWACSDYEMAVPDPTWQIQWHLFFLSFPFARKKKKFSACLLEQGNCGYHRHTKGKFIRKVVLRCKSWKLGVLLKKKEAIFHQSPNCEFGIDKMLI